MSYNIKQEAEVAHIASDHWSQHCGRLNIQCISACGFLTLGLHKYSGVNMQLQEPMLLSERLFENHYFRVVSCQVLNTS